MIADGLLSVPKHTFEGNAVH